MANKEELFTDEMGKNIFVFDTGKHVPYIRQEGKVVKGSIVRVYRPITKNNKTPFNRSYGSTLRY